MPREADPVGMLIHERINLSAHAQPMWTSRHDVRQRVAAPIAAALGRSLPGPPGRQRGRQLAAAAEGQRRDVAEDLQLAEHLAGGLRPHHQDRPGAPGGPYVHDQDLLGLPLPALWVSVSCSGAGERRCGAKPPGARTLDRAQGHALGHGGGVPDVSLPLAWTNRHRGRTGFGSNGDRGVCIAGSACHRNAADLWCDVGYRWSAVWSWRLPVDRKMHNICRLVSCGSHAAGF